jgi:hypothetical protein
MKISHIALACAVAFTGTAALAQNESANAPANNNGQPSQSASELGNKAKNGMHKLGDATKNAFNKLRGKSSESQAKSDARHDTRAMGAGKSQRDAAASSGTATGGTATSGSDMSSSRQKRMDDAYSDYQAKQKK